MDVSDINNSGGEELLAQLASLTGLPMPLIQGELTSILENAGLQAQNVSLDEFRGALLTYLDSLHQNFVSPETISGNENSKGERRQKLQALELVNTFE